MVNPYKKCASPESEWKSHVGQGFSDNLPPSRTDLREPILGLPAPPFEEVGKNIFDGIHAAETNMIELF